MGIVFQQRYKFILSEMEGRLNLQQPKQLLRAVYIGHGCQVLVAVEMECFRWL